MKQIVNLVYCNLMGSTPMRKKFKGLQCHDHGHGNHEVISLIEEDDHGHGIYEGVWMICEICTEPFSPHILFKNNKLCVHTFCMHCIAKYIEVKVDENVWNIPCPALNCKQLLDPLFCRSIISKELFDKWCDALCSSTILEFQYRSYCPYQGCSALVTSQCEPDKVLCPNCKRCFCFKCQTPWHAGYRCEESGEFRDRNDILFGELVEKNKWKRCYLCSRCIERVGGCPRVRCRVKIIRACCTPRMKQVILYMGNSLQSFSDGDEKRYKGIGVIEKQFRDATCEICIETPNTY